METLKEYVDFLFKEGYNLDKFPYTFLNRELVDITFVRNNFRVILQIEPTSEFEEYLSNLEESVEYEIDYNNYIVVFANIESPICNICDFYDGNTNYIQLCKHPGFTTYIKHGLDLFEYCLSLQKCNILQHELKILSKRIELLTWAKGALIPVLEKLGFVITYDSIFNTESNRDSSDILLVLQHEDYYDMNIETDCLTGEHVIYFGKDITSNLLWKSKDECKFIVEQLLDS